MGEPKQNDQQKTNETDKNQIVPKPTLNNPPQPHAAARKPFSIKAILDNASPEEKIIFGNSKILNNLFQYMEAQEQRTNNLENAVGQIAQALPDLPKKFLETLQTEMANQQNQLPPGASPSPAPAGNPPTPGGGWMSMIQQFAPLAQMFMGGQTQSTGQFEQIVASYALEAMSMNNALTKAIVLKIAPEMADKVLANTPFKQEPPK